jgi:hypothetical protein
LSSITVGGVFSDGQTHQTLRLSNVSCLDSSAPSSGSRSAGYLQSWQLPPERGDVAE